MNTSSALRVLLLEDSDLDAELTVLELQRGGLELTVHRVQTGADFERELMMFQPELILLDYMLPTFDGGQGLALAKQRWPDVPVIMISGAVGEETAVELLRSGATDFVLKNRMGRLVPAVQRALREVSQLNARRQAEANLLELNAQLENRVAERTHELGEKNALMEADLDMARELQMAFLPHHFPTLPRGVEPAESALRFHSIYHPTHLVSGDFFNIVRVSETAVGLFMCDVMGHGVRAALVTAMMRALEEQLHESAADPGGLLTEMNTALRGILSQLGTTLFTTACYIIVDVAEARLTYANAGHPSPLLVNGRTYEVDALTVARTAGPALGLFENVEYHTRERSINAGDLVLAFTDGLFEVENSNDAPFSYGRLREAVRRHSGVPLGQLMQDVFDEIEHFANGKIFADDVCFVGIEIDRLMAATGEEESLQHSMASSS